MHSSIGEGRATNQGHPIHFTSQKMGWMPIPIHRHAYRTSRKAGAGAPSQQTWSVGGPGSGPLRMSHTQASASSTFLAGLCSQLILIGLFVLHLFTNCFTPCRFQPMKKSRNSHHSTGAVYIAILNNPPAIRLLPTELILAMVIPGPNEPTTAQLNKIIGSLIDDLDRLYQGEAHLFI